MDPLLGRTDLIHNLSLSFGNEKDSFPGWTDYLFISFFFQINGYEICNKKSLIKITNMHKKGFVDRGRIGIGVSCFATRKTFNF